MYMYVQSIFFLHGTMYTTNAAVVNVTKFIELLNQKKKLGKIITIGLPEKRLPTKIT